MMMFVKIFLNEFDYDIIEQESHFNPNATKLYKLAAEYIDLLDIGMLLECLHKKM